MMLQAKRLSFVAVVLAAGMVAACGGGVENSNPVSSGNSYTVGGTVSGLSGTVVLQNNHGDNLAVPSNGAFRFASRLSSGGAYSVTVYSQPAGQTCSVVHGAGTISGAAVINVSVNCVSTTTPTVSVTISPSAAWLVPGGTRTFTASVTGTTNTAVTWSMREAAGGSITALGIYTAPSVAGTYHVVATEPISGQTAAAPVTVAASAGTMHGLTIPTVHPRLWFYPSERLATARAWAAANSGSLPGVDMGNPNAEDYYEAALRGLLENDATYCNFVKNWAIGKSTGMISGAVSCDDCRWVGETLILAYDWCYASFTPAERTSYIASTNAWLDHWRQQSWGGPDMPENNYHWGYTRNELEWAIASYEDNAAAAQVFLDDVFTSRLEQHVYPAMDTGGPMKGGVGREGTQYGIYIPYYASLPGMTSGLLGRDLLGEYPYWMEAAYALMYAVTPGPTTGGRTGSQTNLQYAFFPYSDDENWLNGGEAMNEAGAAMSLPATYMSVIAQRFAGTNLEGHARQWLAMVGSTPRLHALATDPGGTALPFTGLPPDYYAAGAGHLYGRSAWGATATTFQWDLKDGPGNGHAHSDWGSWQIWRNGRFLSRESVAYGEVIAGYGGNGTVSANLGLGHNVLLIDGAESHSDQWIDSLADVVRLEVSPAYAYAVTDLNHTINNSSFVSWVREYVFVRALETTVILDRVESSTAGATKTFLAHCETLPTASASSAACTNGTEELVITTLVPATPTYRVVAEGGSVGQYRIEIDTAPGTAQSYILTVLQAKGQSAAALSPSVVDNGTSYTLTLNGANSITFNKGMSSSGGSITAAGITRSFRTDVQTMTVGDAGPVWQ